MDKHGQAYQITVKGKVYTVIAPSAVQAVSLLIAKGHMTGGDKFTAKAIIKVT